MRFLAITLAGLAVVGVALGSCQETAGNAPVTTSVPAASTSAAGVAPVLQSRNPRYRLRKGDTFDLDFALTPDFNQAVAIQPDGYITLRGVGSVFVEGQNVPELTETIKQAYVQVLHDPVIAISLKDFEKPYFIAAGQVGRPGKYDLRGDLTVTGAVAIAGGFDEKSKHSQVVLFRPLPSGGYETKIVNVKKLLAERNLAEDVQLKPGDLLYVPQNTLSKIRPYLPSSSVSAFLGQGGIL